MSIGKEAAARHHPIAFGRTTDREARPKGLEAGEAHRTSEMRLQAAVGTKRGRDELDPYADVPCTD